jgi:hypothetical protein
MDEAFGFCTYGRYCYLKHQSLAPIASAEESMKALSQLATSDECFAALCELGLAEDPPNDYEPETEAKCQICSFQASAPEWVVVVGEAGRFRGCSECNLAAYHPIMVRFLETLLTEEGSNYNSFKERIDEFRRRAPNSIKVPISFEAHRFGTMHFGWSLFSLTDATHVLEALYKYNPSLGGFVSIGAGTGYTEHLLRKASENMQLDSLKKLTFFAFDERLPKEPRFGVAVSYGTPEILRSFRDLRDTTLLLCWPPFSSKDDELSTMASDALTIFVEQGGRSLVYIGDGASTGDWKFHELLTEHWKPLPGYRFRRELRRWIPQEMGLVYAGNDTVGVYSLR